MAECRTDSLYSCPSIVSTIGITRITGIMSSVYPPSRGARRAVQPGRESGGTILPRVVKFVNGCIHGARPAHPNAEDAGFTHIRAKGAL